MTLHQVHFGRDDDSPDGLSDGEFLQAVRWNRNAPSSLVASATAGDVDAFTRRLRERRCLARRGGGGKRLAEIVACSPALWSASAFADSPRTAELVRLRESFLPGARRRKHNPSTNGRCFPSSANGSARPAFAAPSKSERQLADWLEAGVPRGGFELLVLLEMLPAIGCTLSGEVRWKLWRTVLTAAVQSCRDFDPADADAAEFDRLLIDAGELPIVAGLLFAGVKSAAKLRQGGAACLSQALLHATDEHGVPKADLMERLPLWLAPLVRASQWSGALRERLWSEDAQDRCERLVRVVAPLCRADGRLALGNGAASPAVPVLRAAAGVVGLRPKSGPARLLAGLESGLANGRIRSGKNGSRARSTFKRNSAANGRQSPAMQSDASRLACLRTDWSPQAAVLAVAHTESSPRIDLSIAGGGILSGDWTVDVTVDGTSAPVDGGWECTCWFSDRDVDFLELQHKTDGRVTIERQILLSRRGEFAVFADCLTAAPGRSLSYCSQLPAEPGTAISADSETRELGCRRGEQGVRCYPLSLPCDRVYSAAGRFEEFGGQLQLTQAGAGGMVAPVVVDWSTARRKREAEWRQLTVAADGKRVPAENAAGFRLRVGDLHLVVYRSLRLTEEPRTVLGMHTRNETVVGRFGAKGTIDPLLLVE